MCISIEALWKFEQEAKGWQTVIGAPFGFIGLASAALLNAHLARRRDSRLADAEAHRSPQRCMRKLDS